jgi:hypothetical protein
MEASGPSAPSPETAPAASDQLDVSGVHALLDQAEQAYHALFDGHVADEVARFGPFLNTVRMIVDQSADRVGKGE